MISVSAASRWDWLVASWEESAWIWDLWEDMSAFSEVIWDVEDWRADASRDSRCLILRVDVFPAGDDAPFILKFQTCEYARE